MLPTLEVRHNRITVCKIPLATYGSSQYRVSLEGGGGGGGGASTHQFENETKDVNFLKRRLVDIQSVSFMDFK